MSDAAPQPPEHDLTEILFAALDLVADREDFLSSLFEVVEAYLSDEIAFAPLGERVDGHDRGVGSRSGAAFYADDGQPSRTWPLPVSCSSSSPLGPSRSSGPRRPGSRAPSPSPLRLSSC